jgi:hypothetical protein
MTFSLYNNYDSYCYKNNENCNNLNNVDIVYISISKIYKYNEYKKENQHLVIIKRPLFQENISLNYNDIISLLKKYNIEHQL